MTFSYLKCLGNGKEEGYKKLEYFRFRPIPRLAFGRIPRRIPPDVWPPTAYPSHHNESPGDEFEQCPDANRGLDRGLWQGSGASEKVPAENCAIGFTDFPGSSSSGTFPGPWGDFTEF